MTIPARNRESNIRWREWQARGAESDRRTDAIMGSLATIIGLGLVVVLFIAMR